MAALGDGFEHLYCPAVERPDIFLDGDRVRAFGHRGAGEDAHRLAGADRAAELLSRRRGSGHHQPRRHLRHVSGAHGIAVHGGSREGRLCPERDKGRRQHAPGRLRQRHGFGFQRLCIVQQALEGVGNRQQRHGYSAAR